uniref:Uncharacterized protein n=1 Tax=Tetranychus urticae TaxID=32264 RepID=T1KHI8_TETUR
MYFFCLFVDVLTLKEDQINVKTRNKQEASPAN